MVTRFSSTSVNLVAISNTLARDCLVGKSHRFAAASEIDSKRPYPKRKIASSSSKCYFAGGELVCFTDFYHSEAQIVAQTAGTPKNHFEPQRLGAYQ